MTSRSRLDLWKIVHSFRNEFFTCLFKIQNVQVIQNDVIKCCKMMSSNVALLHSNNCCVLEPAICEDLDLHVVIFPYFPEKPAQLGKIWNYRPQNNALPQHIQFSALKRGTIVGSGDDVCTPSHPGIFTFSELLGFFCSLILITKAQVVRRSNYKHRNTNCKFW